jgi:hypothetical protein
MAASDGSAANRALGERPAETGWTHGQFARAVNRST